MRLEDVVNMVQFRLGNRRGMNDIVKLQLEITKKKLEWDSFKPWFLLSEMNTSVAQEGKERLTVPRNMTQEYEEGALRLRDMESGETWLLKKGIEQELDHMNYQGRPTHYALTNRYFRLYPVPDKDYEAELIFYKFTNEFKNGETHEWFDAGLEWLVWSTVYEIAVAQRAKDAQVFLGEAMRARQDLIIQHEARKAANFEINMGGC